MILILNLFLLIFIDLYNEGGQFSSLRLEISLFLLLKVSKNVSKKFHALCKFNFIQFPTFKMLYKYISRNKNINLKQYYKVLFFIFS